jgi:putative methionine-R-sulfoxide reductase with GAF domain
LQTLFDLTALDLVFVQSIFDNSQATQQSRRRITFAPSPKQASLTYTATKLAPQVVSNPKFYSKNLVQPFKIDLHVDGGALDPATLALVNDAINQVLPYLRFAPEHRELFRSLHFELKNFAKYRKDTWMGFYLLGNSEFLELGPFVGFETEHHSIALAHGLCGAALREQKTVIAHDVSLQPDYLACSPFTRSEMVVPIQIGQRHLLELDLDSAEVGAYDAPEVQKKVTNFAESLGPKFEKFFK